MCAPTRGTVDTAFPKPSSDPCSEGAGHYTLMSYSFSFAAWGLSNDTLLSHVPASAVLRLLPSGPFLASSPGYLTHGSCPYPGSMSPVAPPRNAPVSRNEASRNPHCATCAVVAFSAARGQPCSTHLRHLGLPADCTCSSRARSWV